MDGWMDGWMVVTMFRLGATGHLLENHHRWRALHHHRHEPSWDWSLPTCWPRIEGDLRDLFYPPTSCDNTDNTLVIASNCKWTRLDPCWWSIPLLVSRHIGVVLNPEARDHLIDHLLLTRRFNLAKRTLVKKDDGFFATFCHLANVFFTRLIALKSWTLLES